MRTALVTGGAGFIGSHLVEGLLSHGYKVRVLDDLSSGRIGNLSNFINNIEFIKGDICSLQACLKASREIDFVFHQAALRSVPKSFSDPHAYNKVNIGGTLNMLEASKENKIKCFIFASSSSVYGDADIFPEKECLLPKPISPYALTKLTGEHYCRIFSYHYKLPTVALRYFNVFGPRQSLDDEYAVVIPKFISCMLRNKKPPIYGTGKQSRDFTYVTNIVRANILSVKKSLPGSRVFNVASGKDYSILELVSVLNKVLGKNIKPKFMPARKGDVFKTLADLSMARKILNFKLEIDFIQGLELSVKYFKEKCKRK